MGFLKSGALVILSIILFLSVSVGAIFWTVSASLEYDVISGEVAPVVEQMIGSQMDLSKMEMARPYFEDYCLPHSEFIMSTAVGNISIPCGTVTSGISSTIEFIKGENEFFKVKENELILAGLLTSGHDLMVQYCEENEEFKYKDNFTNMDFNFSCSIVDSDKSLFSVVIDSLVDEAYYADYNCDFWNCLEETGSPFFLVSEKARDYWSAKFNYMLAVSLLVFVLMFLFSEKKSTPFFIFGGVLIISSLPLLRIESVLLMIINPVIKTYSFLNSFEPAMLLSVVKIFFIESGSVFVKHLLIGIFLIICGFGVVFYEPLSSFVKSFVGEKIKSKK